MAPRFYHFLVYVAQPFFCLNIPRTIAEKFVCVLQLVLEMESSRER